jgi:hypothetical protein
MSLMLYLANKGKDLMSRVGLFLFKLPQSVDSALELSLIRHRVLVFSKRRLVGIFNKCVIAYQMITNLIYC